MISYRYWFALTFPAKPSVVMTTNPNTLSIRQIGALSVSKASRKFGLMNRVVRNKESSVGYNCISSSDFYTCVTQRNTRKNRADMKTFRTPEVTSSAHTVCILH